MKVDVLLFVYQYNKQLFWEHVLKTLLISRL